MLKQTTLYKKGAASEKNPRHSFGVENGIRIHLSMWSFPEQMPMGSWEERMEEREREKGGNRPPPVERRVKNYKARGERGIGGVMKDHSFPGMARQAYERSLETKPRSSVHYSMESKR